MDNQEVTNAVAVVGLTQVVTIVLLIGVIIMLRGVQCKCKCNCPPLPPNPEEAARIDLTLDPKPGESQTT